MISLSFLFINYQYFTYNLQVCVCVIYLYATFHLSNSSSSLVTALNRKKKSYNKTNYMHKFLKFIFGVKLYMFRTFPLYIIRSFSLYTQQTCMTYTIAVCTLKKTPDDGQRNCPKHVEFYYKNKFEKLDNRFGASL